MAKSALPAINLQMPESVMGKAMNVAFVGAAAGGAYLLVKKLVNDAQRTSALKDYGNPNSTDGLAARFATQFYSAIVQTAEWVNDTVGDGTDQDLVYKTAGEMYRTRVTLYEVSAKYKALYRRDLVADLQKDLSAAEMESFNRMISSGLSGVSAPAVLVTVAPGFVLNERLQRLAFVEAGTLLGRLADNYVLPDNRILLGFLYHSSVRYIDSASVKQVSNVPA